MPALFVKPPGYPVRAVEILNSSYHNSLSYSSLGIQHTHIPAEGQAV